MTGSSFRRGAALIAPARARRLARCALLGSSALIAASLAVSGAMAQTYNPSGGGTIVITGGGATTDNTATSGGFSNVGGATIAVDGVSIINTTGAPTTSAINFTRSSFSGSGDGGQFTGVTTLVGAPGGSAFNFVSTGGNNTGFGFNGTLNATGLDGIVISTDGTLFHSGAANINLTAQTNGSGSGLLWISHSGSIADTGLTGAFNATGFATGVDLTAAGFINFSTGAGGAITGVNTGLDAQAGGDITLSIGSDISATNRGIVADAGGAISIEASGDITAGFGAGIHVDSALASGNTIDVSGSITGLFGINLSAGGFTVTIADGATVTGTGSNNRAILGQADSTVLNHGSLLTTASDTNFSVGVQFATSATVVNTGVIDAATSGGIGAYANGALTLTNSGTVSGGSLGVYAGAGSSITNQNGGVIAGGAQAIMIAGAATIDLQAGSTTGGINAAATAGTQVVTVAGALTGAYTGGSGVDSITLAATGSMTSASLGDGDDVFIWQGGTIDTVIDAGFGADSFISDLGTGSASLSLNSLTGFESYAHQTGDLTLTGSRTGGAGWTLVPGTSLTLDGSLSVTGTAIQMNGNGDAATVSILAGSTLSGYQGVHYNTGFPHNFSNAGAITATSMGVFSNGPLSATNTGSITATTGSAFSFGFSTSTVTNSGALTGGSDADTGFGVWSFNGATVNNTAAITGGAGGISSGRVIGATAYGGLLTVTNGATGEITGGVGITTGGSSSLTLDNSGLVDGIVGSGIVTNGTGAVSITNQIGGRILSSGQSDTYSIHALNGLALTNAGTIANRGGVTASRNYGVFGGSGTILIDNLAAGEITGLWAGVMSTGSLDLVNAGLINGDRFAGVETMGGVITNLDGGRLQSLSGDGYGVLINGGGVTVDNQLGGEIEGGVNGVFNRSFDLLTLINAGEIFGVAAGASSTGSATITNAAGGVLLGGANGVVLNGAASAVDNSGVIRGLSANGVNLNGGGATVTNNAGGVIAAGGNEGVYSASAGNSILNAGVIAGSINGVTGNGHALTVTNSGLIVSGLVADATTSLDQVTRSVGGNGVGLTAGGTVVNLADGVIAGGASGITIINGTGAITNAGLIDASGGSGVVMNLGGTITNQDGGVIVGATNSLQLSGASAYTIDLQEGSTTTGQVLVTSSGTTTTTIAGDLDGAYNAASATGVNNLTLAATGSMTSASLGAANDTVTYQGGAFSGLIDAGTGTDSFISSLGAPGVSALNLSSLTNFESFAHQSGQLTLTGAGAFVNGATVQDGTLVVDGTLTAVTLVESGAALTGSGVVNGAVTVADGGILSGAQGVALSMGSLTLSSGSIINAAFTGTGGGALFDITGNVTLDGTVNVASTGAFGQGVYGFMTYGGLLTDLGLEVGMTPGGFERVLVQTSVAGQVNLIHAPSQLLFWDGGDTGLHDNDAIDGGSGTWTAGGSEWTDATGGFNGAMLPQPGFAAFQGGAGTVTVDDVDGAVGVTGMQFAVDGYRIEGDAITLAAPSTTIRVGNGTAPGAGWSTTIESKLAGAGGLLKTDLGTLILTGDNSYTGGTTVNAGVLQIGDGGMTGDFVGEAVLANGAALNFNRSDNAIFTNAISGTGSVGVIGTVTLTGLITASNGVNVSAGSTATLSNVNVAGTAVTTGLDSTVNVSAGGTIQGQTGVFVIAADGTVNNAGTIQGQTGVFSSGDLTLSNMGAGAIDGVFAVSAAGDLNLTNAGTINATVVNFNNSGIYAGGTGTISNTGSIISGANAIYTQGVGSVVNSGLIQSSGAAATIRLFGANSSVTNQADGRIATTGTGIGVYLDGADASVVNAGAISGRSAISLVSGGAVTNSGTLTGTDGASVVFRAAGSLDNQASSVISGAANGVTYTAGSAIVTNSGAIAGLNGAGLNLSGGGTVDNAATGQITGTGNAAVLAGGALNLVSAGSLVGDTGLAIVTVGDFDNVIDLQAGSSTSGSIFTDLGRDTVIVAGSVSGSVSLGAGDDSLTLISGGAVTGVLDGGSGVDALNLAGAGDTALDSGLITGFETRNLDGSGVWTLGGVDAEASNWILNAGTLRLTGGASVNDLTGVLVNAGATLAVIDSEAIGSLNGAGAVIIDADRMLYVGMDDSDSGFSGVISGTGGLSQYGAGTLILSGANTYTGDTRVEFGTLQLGALGVLADSGRLIVQSGATFDMQAYDETVAAAYLNGVVNGSGVLTAGIYGLTGATINADLGVGVLVNNSGVSTLNGTSAAELVNVLGGTLQLGGSERLADAAGLIVSHGAILDLQGFDETVDAASLAGTVVGTGLLTANQYELTGATINSDLGAGVLLNHGGVSMLNGTSAAELVRVLGGTLQLGASERLSDAAIVAVASGATLDLTAFDQTVNILALSGTLDGTGTLTAAQYQLAGGTVNADLGGGALFQMSGVSTLNGVSSAQAVVIQGGTLSLGGAERLSDTATVQVDAGASLALRGEIERIGALFGSGQVDVGSGRLILDGPNSAFDGMLTGLGEVEHTAGVFTLMGDHEIGSILNSGGELRYLAQTSGSVNITGGALTGAGTIGGALTLSSGGVLSPGITGIQNGIGSFSVGSLVMNGGTLALDVQGELIDYLLVNGTADLRGGLVDPTFQGEASDFNFSTRYVFLQAGDVIGRFANGGEFTAFNEEGIYWRLRYDLLADAVVIELRQLVDFDPGPTGSGNARSVAVMLSKGQLEASDDFSAVLELMADLDAEGRLAAFDSMSGEGLASVGASFHTADDAFLRTLWSGGSAPGSVQMNGAGAGRLPAIGGWATFYTSERTLDGAAGQASVQTRLEGAAGGYNLALGPVTLGAAGGVSNLEGKVDQRGTRYDSDVTHVGAFARYSAAGWTFDLTGTHFSGDVDTHRWVEIGDYAGQASGLTQAEGGSVALRLSHRFDLSADTRLVLGVAGAIGRSEVDAYTEQGAGGLSLEVATQDREWRSVQLGVRGEHSVDLRGAQMNLYAGVAGVGQVGDTAAIGDMRLTGAASGFGDFRVEGAEAPSFATQLEFGAEVMVEQGVAFSIGYRGLVSDRLQDHAVGAGLRLRW